MSAVDLEGHVQRSLDGTGDSSVIAQLRTSTGPRNRIIPRLCSQQKQNPAANEIERLQCTINQLQNQMKQLQPGDGDCISTDLRWKLNKVEKEKLELTSQFNEERSKFESHVARLRAQLEKGEALRQTLEYELAVAKKEASVVRCTSEDRIESVHKIHGQLKVENSELEQRVEDLDKTLQISKRAREDDQHRFRSELEDRDKIIQNCNTENEFLIAERNRIDAILQCKLNLKDILLIQSAINSHAIGLETFLLTVILLNNLFCSELGTCTQDVYQILAMLSIHCYVHCGLF